MVKIIFGLIGIVIILAEILNIISTQRLWTKKITLWLAVYCFSAYVLWGDVIFLLIFMGCSTILIKYYYTLQKVSGRMYDDKEKRIRKIFTVAPIQCSLYSPYI